MKNNERAKGKIRTFVVELLKLRCNENEPSLKKYVPIGKKWMGKCPCFMVLEP